MTSHPAHPEHSARHFNQNQAFPSVRRPHQKGDSIYREKATLWMKTNIFKGKFVLSQLFDNKKNITVTTSCSFQILNFGII